MHKIFTIIRAWLNEMLTAEAPRDPLGDMSPRELADLPVYHPASDRLLHS